ncbi:MAG: T9SS type A sorting domain-containing protein [Putridiphycobacter sp.]
MNKYYTFLIALIWLGSVQAQTENYWIKKADFAGLKRERSVAFSINGIGYVGTGVDTTDVTKKDFWAYDPTTNSWTQIADFGGVERRNAVAFMLNDFGYVGTGMSHNESALGTTLSDFWKYDPSSNTWSAVASYPGNSNLGIYFATGFAVDGKGYVCSGKKGPADYTTEFWEYKPTTDSWSQLTDFPGGVRYQLNSFVVKEKAYIGLGVDQDIYRKDIWEYDPATSNWTQKNDFAGSARGALTTFTIGEAAFICLGTDGGFKKDLWEYNPYADTWSIRAEFDGSARKNAVAFVINDTAYVGTGKGVSGKKMSFYAYVPYQNVLNTKEELVTDVSVYPNPATDLITIQIPETEPYNLSFSNILGEQVYHTTIKSSTTINLQNFEKGVYFVTILNENSNQQITRKIIIQ